MSSSAAIAAVVLFYVLGVIAFSVFRDGDIVTRFAFLAGLLVSSLVFNQVEKGRTNYIWILIPLLLFLIPITPRALRKRQEREHRDSDGHSYER